MKVFLQPTGLHSRAMLRVSKALAKYAPPEVTIVDHPNKADVQVLHIISYEGLPAAGREYVTIQYCFKSAGGSRDQWNEFWRRNRFVWSYYNLDTPVPFYFAPLGVEGATFDILGASPRRSVMTSGYVSGPGAEPIEDLALAAEETGLSNIHIGPQYIKGMSFYPKAWKNYLDISDEKLVSLYNQSLWVSGMRHVEGFEMPIIEGLACGARPIAFYREDMLHWYDGHVVFVPEVNGKELREILVKMLQSPPVPVTMDERKTIVTKFNWETIANGFWQQMNV
jgi:hypothetical protein